MGGGPFLLRPCLSSGSKVDYVSIAKYTVFYSRPVARQCPLLGCRNSIFFAHPNPQVVPMQATTGHLFPEYLEVRFRCTYLKYRAPSIDETGARASSTPVVAFLTVAVIYLRGMMLCSCPDIFYRSSQPSKVYSGVGYRQGVFLDIKLLHNRLKVCIFCRQGPYPSIGRSAD